MWLDVHTHIFPGMDDGATSLLESQLMLDRLIEQKVHSVVLTPHFYSSQERLEDFLLRRDRAKEKLLSIEGIKEQSDQTNRGSFASYQGERTGDIKLFEAAECQLSSTLLTYDTLDSLTFGEANYLLIEMTFEEEWSSRRYQLIDELIARFHVRPIIAHVERYPATNYGKDLSVLDELISMGCMLQLNIESLLDRASKRVARKLLSSKLIFVVFRL